MYAYFFSNQTVLQQSTLVSIVVLLFGGALSF